MPHTSAVPDSITDRSTCPVPSFTCTLRAGGDGSAWVHVTGDLDLDNLPRLERALRRAELRARLIVLDLRGLTSMHAGGVHVIAYASIRARRVNRRLILVRGPSQVDHVLALPEARDVLEIVDPGLPVEAPSRFGVLGRGEDAVAAYAEVVARTADVTAPGLWH